jgi:hypothetical protein
MQTLAALNDRPVSYEFDDAVTQYLARNTIESLKKKGEPDA